MDGFGLYFPTGMKIRGTLDPKKFVGEVKNEDGSVSTVRTMSFYDDETRGEVLVPTVNPDGYIMTTEEAIERYRETGEHFGVFEDPKQADAHAKAIHEDHALQMKMRKAKQKYNQ